ARIACGLDRVIFIPAADPPHKKLAGDVPFNLRCQMVRLAITGNPYFEMSLLEGERSGKSYSIDTIRIFHKRMPYDELFFIIGGDSFLEIGLWHRYGDIFRSCNLIVFERPGGIIDDPYDALPVVIRGEFGYDAESRRLTHSSGHSVHFVPGDLQDISSTEIRRLYAAGKCIDHLVPPEVAAYISQQRIYNECL
ncbi:MAG: nicotinate (nicotinamide) nucleotide adenylyltransferase, partial [Steroidobacteraceae bacterium]|nr:nicotinate (nicotinamide) nucleotide adenylyltransferase [Deltaproteobacteria bacterium]